MTSTTKTKASRLTRAYRRLRKRLSGARLLGRYLHALTTVQLRRRARGPLRATWTPRFEALVELLRRDADRLRGLTAVDLRARMAPMPSKAAARVDVSPQRAGDGPAGEWFAPRGITTRGTLLYLHGGGYIFGSPRTHRDLLARLAVAANVRVFALDYRLAPEHPFPAAVEDAHAAYRWLLDRSGERDGERDGERGRSLLVAGDSAGGGLTMATLLAVRDAGDPLPAGAALLSPWLDLSVELPSVRGNAAFDWIDEDFLRRCARDYLGESGDGRHHHASPLHAELRGLPPVLVQVGSAEVLLDEARQLVARAHAAGVEATLEEWPDMVHVWQMFAEVVPEGRAAIDALGRFLRGRLAVAAASSADANAGVGAGANAAST